ncbi:hypothetical protein BOSEA31B_20353 [Hyphomicrobiales bacterium]|nr:hypothetical protein BOSEA31B_20353 [Hyphomicrobiales bacterium]CAH1702271.1 hypothetical protein BOSEA1005_30143 [Hyphomicrobiales bacterium]
MMQSRIIRSGGGSAIKGVFHGIFDSGFGDDFAPSHGGNDPFWGRMRQVTPGERLQIRPDVRYFWQRRPRPLKFGSRLNLRHLAPEPNALPTTGAPTAA